MKFSTSNYLNAHSSLFKKLDLEAFNLAMNLIKEKFEDGKKIITLGNGGSAHTASHFITDWNKMVNLATGKIFNGICLCDNVGLVTAYANDINYDQVYEGQLKTMLTKDDLVIAISGSGNSKNVLNAINYANDKGADSLGLVGYDGGELIKIAKKNVHIPSFDMQLCEDVHLIFGHMTMKYLCNTNIAD